jgi:hypothetical protein
MTCKIIKFPKLKIGDVYKLKIVDTLTYCRIMSYEGNNLYVVKALEGQYKSFTALFRFEDFNV